jgi:hypothetical protein
MGPDRFWRPLTAIREGNNDTHTHSKTVGDPEWEPLFNTPNYPEHTSGANNLTGAVTRALALFFGTDKMTSTVTTANPLALQPTRTFDRFSDAEAQVVVARIYEGITSEPRTRRGGSRAGGWPNGLSPLLFKPICDDDDHHDHDHHDDHDRRDRNR